jgi:hypothetical protein
MGPRTNPANANNNPESLEDVIRVLKSLSAKFDAFSTKIAMVDSLGKQMKAMDSKLASLEAKLSEVLEKTKP